MILIHATQTYIYIYTYYRTSILIKRKVVKMLETTAFLGAHRTHCSPNLAFAQTQYDLSKPAQQQKCNVNTPAILGWKPVCVQIGVYIYIYMCIYIERYLMMPVSFCLPHYCVLLCADCNTAVPAPIAVWVRRHTENLCDAALQREHSDNRRGRVQQQAVTNTNNIICK